MKKADCSIRILFIILLVLSLLSGCSSTKKESLTAVPTSSFTERSNGQNVKEEVKPVEQVPTPQQPEIKTQKPGGQATQASAKVKVAPLITPVNPEKVKEADKIYDQGFQIYISRNFDEAIKYFNKAIQVDPGCYKAITFKGAALCFKGDYNDGNKLIDKALELKPDFPYCNFNKAMAYKLQKDYKNALIWFDKTISFDPQNTWSYFGKATIYSEWNDAPRAVEELRKAIGTDPGVKDAARNEKDFDNVRNDPEFVKLLK